MLDDTPGRKPEPNITISPDEVSETTFSIDNDCSTIDNSTVPQIINPLVPWPRGKARVTFIAIVSAALAVTGAVLLGQLDRSSESYAQRRCSGRRTSTSAVETHFEINVAMLQDLSFARAKIIDLLWDTVVAHGGRVLHGWIFYHVACRTVTWILEYSALPYWFLLDILFRPDSLLSLRSLLRSFTQGHQATTILCLVLLTYGVGHVLFFGTLWSAATGYQSSDIPGYILPDHSHIFFPDHDQLRMCWILNAERIPSSYAARIGIMSDVVLGPKVGTIFATLDDLLNQGEKSMWRRSNAWNSTDLWNITQYGSDSDSDFRDVLSCKPLPSCKRFRSTRLTLPQI
jgi:hypothetical protein